VVRLALTERDFTFDGEFFPVQRPTTIATRPLQDRLPVWLGASSRATMRLAAARGWNVMRNFGSNAEHRDALEDYIKVAAENGYTRSGANMLLERFVAIGETEEQAERNLDRMARAFRHFLSLYIAGGRRSVPQTDAEFHVEGITDRKSRPVIAVSGTPDQIVGALQQVIDETSARRLLIETFSREEARLFAREVIPVLKERNATAAEAGPKGERA
jgi:alkanesulfonate monooxygenase SsuD/methylene tetrahydromethanopterin reductase-like flavin-dependent oxidoreductase (luciferase family)